jgi:hypothetical protein
MQINRRSKTCFWRSEACFCWKVNDFTGIRRAVLAMKLSFPMARSIVYSLLHKRWPEASTGDSRRGKKICPRSRIAVSGLVFQSGLSARFVSPVSDL